MNIAETAAQLQTIQQAMILIHQSPDGDCIGSGYALAALLRQMGCHAVVRCSDPIPERYAFLTVEETPDTVDEDAAVILSVDVADRKLLGDLDEPYGGRVALAIVAIALAQCIVVPAEEATHLVGMVSGQINTSFTTEAISSKILSHYNFSYSPKVNV